MRIIHSGHGKRPSNLIRQIFSVEDVIELATETLEKRDREEEYFISDEEEEHNTLFKVMEACCTCVKYGQVLKSE